MIETRFSGTPILHRGAACAAPIKTKEVCPRASDEESTLSFCDPLNNEEVNSQYDGAIESGGKWRMEWMKEQESRLLHK
jgi:hypothetical protein